MVALVYILYSKGQRQQFRVAFYTCVRTMKSLPNLDMPRCNKSSRELYMHSAGSETPHVMCDMRGAVTEYIHTSRLLCVYTANFVLM